MVGLTVLQLMPLLRLMWFKSYVLWQSYFLNCNGPLIYLIIYCWPTCFGCLTRDGGPWGTTLLHFSLKTLAKPACWHVETRACSVRLKMKIKSTLLSDVRLVSFCTWQCGVDPYVQSSAIECCIKASAFICSWVWSLPVHKGVPYVNTLPGWTVPNGQ